MSVQVTCNLDLIDRAPVPADRGQSRSDAGASTFPTPAGPRCRCGVSDIRPSGSANCCPHRKAAAAARRRGIARSATQATTAVPAEGGRPDLGLASAAQRDVVAVATARWPSVRFEIRDATVQGPAAVPSILPLLAGLDAAEHVEVIVIARGGGSVEDPPPFSDETLLRAVSVCRTPVISAIGHEPDSPPRPCGRCARCHPTDAAKRAVPDVQDRADRDRRSTATQRARSAQLVHREEHGLAGLRARPVLARPLTMVDARADDITRMRSTPAPRHQPRRRRRTAPVEASGRTTEHLGPRTDPGLRLCGGAKSTPTTRTRCRRWPICPKAYESGYGSPTVRPQQSSKRRLFTEEVTKDQRTPVAELGYEAARDELVEVVTLLERGGLGLDACWPSGERGEALASRCEEHLAGARQRIEKGPGSRRMGRDRFGQRVLRHDGFRDLLDIGFRSLRADADADVAEVGDPESVLVLAVVHHPRVATGLRASPAPIAS